MADWIPMEKAKPEKDGLYLVTLDGEICGEDKPIVGTLYFENGEWDTDGDYVLAWRESPEAYIPQEPPMTEAEAATLLEENFLGCCSKRIDEAVIMAREALQKRIPRQVTKSYERYCPSCNRQVMPGASFCHFCGQALEWEE